MTRIPVHHRARSHARLFRDLSHSAQMRFARAELGSPSWKPLDSEWRFGSDLGSGLLDAFALALHVLWVYQEAWTAEGFLGTARLDDSVRALLRQIQVEPNPGLAAVGLQHFTCRPGMAEVLPRGTRVRSPRKGSEDVVEYETLHPLPLVPEHNEVRAYLPRAERPAAPPSPPLDGFPSDDPGSPPAPSPDRGLLSPYPLLDAMRDRIAARRGGDRRERRAARTQRRVQDLARVIQTLKETGAADECREEVEMACAELCAAAPDALCPDAPSAAGDLPESMTLLDQQLRRLRDSQQAAVDAIEGALRPCPGEESAETGRRVDQMLVFLDAVVTGLVQDARDRVVLLHGAGALERLDQAYGSGEGRFGHAAPGTDTFYLVELSGETLTPRTFPAVRPGDWFVIAEIEERIDSRGKTHRQRHARQAIQVQRVAEDVPVGQTSPRTRITVRPPLRRYDLDRVVLVGNLVPVSEGTSVDELALPSADGRTLGLRREPLTWIPDPSCPGGRRPAIELTVDDRSWSQAPNLLNACADDTVYTVENGLDGRTRLRFGDGVHGARLPRDARVRIRYRVGLGAGGNRDGDRVNQMVTSHPAVLDTRNPLPFTGGADAETGDAPRTSGPASTRALDRAVSLADLRALAIDFDGITRAEVSLGFRRGREVATVVVAGVNGQPLARETLALVERHLAYRVPPGIAVRVMDQVPVDLCLALRVRYRHDAEPMDVVRRVRARLGIDEESGAPPGLLDPRRVEIGQAIRTSDLYGALDDVEGLGSAVVLAFHRLGEPARLAHCVAVASHEMPRWVARDVAPAGMSIEIEEARDL